ncbi:MAG: hypothetical protein LBS60_15810 [Deltaproteobacteria bacterium]|jgi:phage host-nuclease inhibitor protein Gam|nr:hypothetical protein [Deltaproteobacteria bacterium]
MKKQIFTLVVSLLFATSGTLLAKNDMLNDLYNLVDKYTTARDKLPKAKDSFWSFVPFTGEDKKDIQNDINSFLDKALAELLDDSAIKTKNEINELEEENKSLTEKIAKYEMEKSSAPSSSSKLKFWEKSTGDLDDNIRSTQRKIDDNNAKIRSKRRDIKADLARAKIDLTDDQIKTLLITVSGQDQLDAIVALKNLYALTDALKKLMANSNNLTINKKYYGVFLLATEAHQRQLVLFISRLNNQYLPKLKALKEENQALLAKTRRLAEGNRIYQSNVEAQEITNIVADKYRDLLINQRGNLENRLETITEILKYVENTYRTVSLASSLATSMEDGINTLQALLEMPIIPPVAFENNLEATFLELSAKLSEK